MTECHGAKTCDQNDHDRVAEQRTGDEVGRRDSVQALIEVVGERAEVGEGGGGEDHEQGRDPGGADALGAAVLEREDLHQATPPPIRKS